MKAWMKNFNHSLVGMYLTTHASWIYCLLIWSQYLHVQVGDVPIVAKDGVVDSWTLIQYKDVFLPV